MSRRDRIGDGNTRIDTATVRAHDGFRPVDVFTFRHRKAGMTAWEPVLRREIVRSPPIVAVLPYDPAAGVVVLLRQFRLGAHLATGKGMLVEIVAGAVDEGEEPEQAARRELAEETSLRALSLRPVMRFLSSPGILDEFIVLYLAKVDARELPPLAGAETGETIYPFIATPEDAVAAADDGAITNAFTLLALNWLDRHKEGLFSE